MRRDTAGDRARRGPLEPGFELADAYERLAAATNEPQQRRTGWRRGKARSAHGDGASPVRDFARPARKGETYAMPVRSIRDRARAHGDPRLLTARRRRQRTRKSRREQSWQGQSRQRESRP